LKSAREGEIKDRTTIREAIMRSVLLLCVLALLIPLGACGRKMKGAYRCVFNCACRDRNIIPEIRFIDAENLTVSDGVEAKKHAYEVKDKKIEIGSIEERYSIHIINSNTFIIQGGGCLGGTYRKIE